MFSLISLLFISQSGHTIYQIKAEYLSKIYVLKRTEIDIFVHYLFKTWIAHLIFKIDYSNVLSLLLIC